MFARLSIIEQNHPEGISAAYTLISQSLITIALAIIKRADQSIYSLLYHRSIMIVIGIFVSRKQEYFPKGKVNTLVFSALILAISAPIFFASLRMISMSESVVISQINTIWGQIMSFFILGEAINKKRIRNILISLSGLILITRPQFLFGSVSDPQHFLGCIIGLVASVLQAASFVSIKFVGNQVSSSVIAFYFHICFALVGGAQIVFMGVNDFYDFSYIILVALSAITTYVSNLFFFRAIQLTNFATIAPYTYTSIIFSLLFDFFLFERIPQLLSILGGSIIVGSIILSLKGY
ncbi:hypothetical protein pb186bvf_003679 [Paramecium bursaria]